MSEYEGEDFLNQQDDVTYFLRHDGINSVSFDLCFSPTSKYYCGANCQICYIKDKLEDTKPHHAMFVPDKITDKQTAMWTDVFSYFYTIRTNEDMSYMKKNYPHVFDWYKENAATFEYGMTDNAIISQHKVLMDDLNLKGLADISLSDAFLNKVNANKNYNKVMEILQDYMDKYGLCKVKIIRTTTGELEPHAYELVSWLADKGIKNCLQSDLRQPNNPIHNLDDVFEYQNTYIMNHEGERYQIYREALNLYNDQFFFNIDDATEIAATALHKIDEEFNPALLLTDMLTEKLNRYKRFGQELALATALPASKFKDYYINTCDTFKVNDDFNFIPHFMLDETTQFYNTLKQNGYVSTDMGLYKPSGNTKPLIDFKD